MVLSRIVARVDVESADETTASEGLQVAIDALVRLNIPVFDSDLVVTTVDEADDAQEIRQEFRTRRKTTRASIKT